MNGRRLRPALATAVVLACSALSAHAVAATAGASVAIVEPSANAASWGYNPTSITISAGTTVTWINRGAQVHSVAASQSSPDRFNSPNLTKGQSYQLLFAHSGTYPYYCREHPWMKGTVIVR